MKNSLIIVVVLLMGLIGACKEDNYLKPFGENDHLPPMDVSNIQVENISGGAVLKYTLPKDADLSYVKAIYVSTQGIYKEVRSSGYVDSVKIEGLGTTDIYLVKLYAVDKFENQSSGVSAEIKPLTPAVWLVRESLNPKVDFGGYVVDFENVAAADVAIYALVKDSIGEGYSAHDAMYTSLKEGRYTVRGLPNKKNTFGLYVRDKYDNMSDTLFFEMVPMREDYLDKKLFKDFFVRGDVKWDLYDGAPAKAWDNQFSSTNYAHTDFPVEFPHRFTMDFGVHVKLSRFKFFQRPGDDVLFQHGAPKNYKVYGRADKPLIGSEENPLEGWILLMECKSFKPSGLPIGQFSGEDVEYNARGEEFSFPRTIKPIRYFRFEILESWSGMKCSTIGELDFYGEITE